MDVADGSGTPAPVPGLEPDLLGQPFRLDSITGAPAPDGAEGIWQRYVIVQGSNTINGLRAGTLSEVRPHIEDMVRRMNERFQKAQTESAGGSGRKSSASRGARTSPGLKSTQELVVKSAEAAGMNSADDSNNN